jgi:hypothetical protein
MAEFSGYKTIIARETSTPGTYETFAQVRDLGGPSATADQIETSHRDSLFRKFQAGMRDGGEMSFDIVFDPDLASHDPTLATSTYKDWENGTVRNYKVTFPGTGTKTTTCTFSGVITGYEFDSPMEDALTAAITIKINGSLTWAHVP